MSELRGLPEKIEPGGAIEDKVTSSLLNALIDAVRRSQPPEQVKGGRIGITPAGWTLEIDPGSRGASSRQPFQVSTRIVNGSIFALIRKGTVNAKVTKIGGDPMVDDLDENSIQITASGETTLYLVARSVEAGTLDFNGVEESEIVIVDPGDDDQTQATEILGSVTVSDGEVTGFSSNLSGSQQVDSCGSVHSWKLI